MESYDVLKALAESRHSQRRFSERPVSEDEVQRVLDIAARAPFASGRKNWQIAVIRDRDTLEALARTVREEAEGLAGKMDEDAAAGFLRYAQSFTFFTQAPVLLVPWCRESATMKSMLRESVTPDILRWEHDNLTKSLSCVAMLVLLAAESLGLGACYMTGPLLAEKQLKEVLGLRENTLIGALIPLGYK